MCQRAGRITAATEVDHIDGDSWNDSPDNYQSLCHDCHARKTFAEATGQEVRVRGCDADGIPHDPGHHWRK